MADAALRLTQWTLEARIWLAEFGVVCATGATNAAWNGYPIMARGFSASGCNYWLGVDAGSMRLRGSYRTPGGVIRSILGRRTLKRQTHYSVAFTRDATHSRLYVNGLLDVEDAQPGTPDDATLWPFALGTAYTDAAFGMWHGLIAWPRVWDHARSASQIAADALTVTSMSGASGLVGEWPLTRGQYSSVGTPTIDIIGIDYSGYYDAPVETHAATVGPDMLQSGTGLATFATMALPSALDEPAVTTLVSPADEASIGSSTVTLQASLEDADGNANTVEFWGRAWQSPPPFTVVTLPDTQVVIQNVPARMIAGFEWIRDNTPALNIKGVLSLGDCVNVSNTTQWTDYSNAMAVIEVPLTGFPEGLPYLHTIGNHDQTPQEDPNGTALANTYFGEARFLGRSYYLGHYGSDNDNNAIRFQVGPDLWITAISIEYDFGVTQPAVSEWVRSIAEDYPDDIVIICCHYLITNHNPGFPTAQWTSLHEQLKDLPQVRLFHSGHLGWSSRVDYYEGNKLYSIMADYQGQDSHVWLRNLRFEPRKERISMRTYHVGNAAHEEKARSQWEVDFPFPGAPAWELLGSVSAVASGATASFDWTGRAAGNYEWFARARNGTVYRDSERRGFTVT